MAVTFPTTLAGVLNRTFAVKEHSSVRTDDSEIGPATYQLLTLSGPTDFKVVWLFEPVEFQLFEGWYRYDLLKGALSFDIDLPVGAGLKSHECNFIDGIYSAAQQGRYWRVSATLRAIAKVYSSETEYDDLLLIINAITSKRKMPFIRDVIELVSVDLPGIWQDVDYGTDTTDIIHNCPLVTSVPGSVVHNFGTQSAPFVSLSGAFEIDDCEESSFEIDISSAPTDFFSFSFEAPASSDSHYNIYIFDSSLALVDQLLGVKLSTGQLDFVYQAPVATGKWTAVITGHKTSDGSGASGVKCGAILAN